MSDCFVCTRTTPDGTNYCTRCAAVLTGELLAIPGLVVDLGIAAARLDKLGRERAGGKSAEVPLPISITRAGHPADYSRPLRDIARAVGYPFTRSYPAGMLGADTSAGLVQLVHNNRAGRTAKPDRAGLNSMPVHTCELQAVWLACHIDSFRKAPAAAHAHLEIWDSVAAARKAVDRLPERVLKGICRYSWFRGPELVECGADLYAEQGAEWVRCDRCDSMYDVRKLEQVALREAEDMAFTLGEIERLMRELGEPVGRSTLYEWANAKKIRPAGWKRNGEIVSVWIHRNDPAVYRLGDVLRLRRSGG